MRKHRVQGAHGLSLAVRETAGSGVPRFLMHGFLLNAGAWDATLDRFARPTRVLAMDCRGHGDSDSDPEFRYHHAAIGMDAVAAHSALELPAVDMIAHSTSGHAAIGLTARHPERVRRLVLIDAGAELSTAGRGGAREAGSRAPIFDSPGHYLDVLCEQFPRAQRETLAGLVRGGLRARPDGRFEAKLDPALTRPHGRSDPRHRQEFDRHAWAQHGERQLWEDLAQIPHPTLVIRGAESNHLSPETVRRMTGDCMADARSVEIPAAGHNAMLDAPEALARAIDAFLSD
jgi:pimeloyl-ACP methyl ester carboxylesterase